jgi:hypothetical protein
MRNTSTAVTPAQTDYVRALQRKLRLPNRMLDDHRARRFGGPFAELDRRQASALLDELVTWEALPAEMQITLGQQALPGL